MDNLLDDLKIPGFHLLETLGVGGMARVYLAEQESLKRKVALKVMHSAGGKAYSERFLNEGRLIAALNHRHVLTIHDIGILDNGLHFISMEFVEGGSLEQRLRQPIEVEQSLALMATLAECLDFVHRQGIVHRDIKPANILFRADGTLLLTDFGIAKQLEQDLNLTQDGAALGSPFYFSPEQAQGRPLDGRADLYSLGVIFYEMLIGAKPFQGDTPIDTIIQHLQAPIPRLPERLSRFQPLLDTLLAKEPDGRPRNAHELLILLDQLQDLPARPRDNFDRWSLQPGKGWWVMSLALLLLLTLVVVFAFWAQSPVKPAATSPTASESDDPLGTFIEQEKLLDKGKTAAPEPTATTTPEPSLPANPTKPAEPSLPANPAKPELAESSLPVNPATWVSNEQLLKSAEACLDQNPLNQLTTNCALDLFKQVLARDPHNLQAKQGLAMMASTYWLQALDARKQQDNLKLRRYLELGLEVNPEHRSLLDLKRQLPKE